MIKSSGSIESVKNIIKSYLGKNVSVRLNMGRNKIISYDGTLSEVYNSLFKVNALDKNFKGKTAYSYSDVLCGNVVIKLICI